MPLRSAQILLRPGSLEAGGAALERALRRQKATTVTRDLLLAAADEWCAIVEHGGAVDKGLARLLSEAVPGPVLAIELDESCFALKLGRFVEGEPQEHFVHPPPDATEMPLLEDVAGRLWKELRDLSVPASLRLLAPDALLPMPFDALLDLEPASGLSALRVTVNGPVVVQLPMRVVPPETPEGIDPPVLPDSMVVSAADEARALEVRRLPPFPPTPQAAGALAAFEEAQGRRTCRKLAAECDDARIPRPAFVYRITLSEGQPDPLLLNLLAEARAARPWLLRLLNPDLPPPLSHAGFSDVCLAAVRAALPEAKVVRAHGLFLELLHPVGEGVLVRVSLRDAFERQLVAEPAVEDPVAPVLEAARSLLALPAPPVSAWPIETVLAGLLPTVIATADAVGRAALPLGGLVSTALLCDDGDHLRAVTDQDLTAHALSFDDALTRALANVDALTLHAPRGLLWFELDHGRVAVTDFDDPAGAGRLLSPLVRSLLLQLLGGTAWASVPTRDTLLACDPEEAEAVAWLREETARRFEEGPFPVDPGLWDLAEDDVEPLADDPLLLVPPTKLEDV